MNRTLRSYAASVALSLPPAAPARVQSREPVVRSRVSVEECNKERFRACIKSPCDAVLGKVEGAGGLSHAFKDPAMQNNSPAFAALDTL